MREALHIFRKDVRALWPQILIALAVASLPVLVRDPQQSDKLIGVLVLARWFLVVSAVHQEKLVGDREWWLTRPNSWKSLLTAKLLLIAAFVQIPLLFSDLAILTSDGLQIAWGRLAARQIQLAIALVLPAAAVAAITPGLASFGLAVLAIWIAIVIPAANDSALMRWGPLEWIPPALMIAVFGITAALLLLWQYSRRRTIPAAGLLSCATIIGSGLLLLPPAGWGVALASHDSGVFDAVGLEWDKSVAPSATAGEHGEVTLNVPVYIARLPDGMLAQMELAELSLKAPDGTLWQSNWGAVYERMFWVSGNSWTWTDPRHATVAFTMDRKTLGRVQNQHTTWRISAAFTVLGPERRQTVASTNGEFAVAGFGFCLPGYDSVSYRPLYCRNSRPPSDRFEIAESALAYSRPEGWMSGFSLTPSPVWSTVVDLPLEWKGHPITFLRRTPIARIRRDLVEQIRLGEYWK